MRIAFITPEYVTEADFYGGLANYLNRVARGLLALGHEPIVIAASDRDEALLEHGIRIHRVDVTPRGWERWIWRLPKPFWMSLSYALQSWKLNRRLRQVHRESAVDVAQFTNYTATALFRPRGIPGVVRLSSIQAQWDAGYEFEYRHGFEGRLLRAVETLSVRRADALVCPSRLLARSAEKLTRLPVDVVPGPYVPPSEVFDPAPYEAALDGKRYALFFGSVGLLKGVDSIAAILERLLAAHADLHFVFIGRSRRYREGSMMDHVFESAGAHRDRVHHFEPLRHEHLYPFIQHADVVVLPSRVDNLPNTCIEAMALGKVVVGTRGASFDELIDDGESGFLCEIDDPESLLTAVEKALVHDDPARIGAAAARRIERLNPAIACEALLRVYARVATRAS